LNWPNIRSHAEQFVFINSDNDPWGCDDKQGKIMREKLGGELIVLHEGHMGSTTYNQPYKEFPLLLDLI
jgi:predicted alpha/beta hydrolase family esterase